MESPKNIIIVGGGGFAYECWNYLADAKKNGDVFNFKGFAAPETPTLDRYNLSHLNLGDESLIAANETDYYIIAIGSPSVRKKVFESMRARGKKFYNLIHPTAHVPEYSRLHMGECNIFAPFSSCNALSVGDCNVVNMFSAFAHDCVVGSFNVLSSYCSLNGYCKMGDLNFFGAYSSLLPKGKMGDGNKVAAGSILYKGCKDSCIMQGNPAVKIGDV